MNGSVWCLLEWVVAKRVIQELTHELPVFLTGLQVNLDFQVLSHLFFKCLKIFQSLFFSATSTTSSQSSNWSTGCPSNSQAVINEIDTTQRPPKPPQEPTDVVIIGERDKFQRTQFLQMVPMNSHLSMYQPFLYWHYPARRHQVIPYPYFVYKK